MISHSIIQFTILYLFFCYYFVFNFILILCHLEVTGYEDKISFLHDYIILGFKCYSVNFINDYIIFDLKYYNNSFIRVHSISTRQWCIEIRILYSKSRQNIFTGNTSSNFLQLNISFRFYNANFT